MGVNRCLCKSDRMSKKKILLCLLIGSIRKLYFIKKIIIQNSSFNSLSYSFSFVKNRHFPTRLEEITSCICLIY